MNSKKDLAFELVFGVIGANMDASMPGSGVLASKLAQSIYKKHKGSDARRLHIQNFVKQLESSLKSYSTSENMAENWQYIKESVIPLAVSVLSTRKFEVEGWLLTHKENPSSLTDAIINDLFSSGVLPDDAHAVSILKLIITSWIDVESTSPVNLQEIAKQFRLYVIENIDQISGDAKSLAALLSGDSLLDPHSSYIGTVPLSTTALLSARNTAVQFHGRTSLIESMLDWCNDKTSGNVSVKLIYGDGGAGKTRLCMRLASILRSEVKATEQWVAGFLDDSMSSLLSEKLQELCRSQRRIFIVVDRAETKHELIEILAKISVRCSQTNGTTIRIILLARNNGDWWQQLSSGNEELNQVLSGPGRRDIYLEPLLANIDERVEYFRSSCTAFHSLTAKNSDTQVEQIKIPSDSVLKNALKDCRYASPLVVQMAAIRRVSSAEEFDMETLFDHALHSEREYWSSYLSKRSVHHLLQTMPTIFALLAIFNGTNCRANTRYLAEKALELDGRDKTEASIVVDLLYSVYQRDPYSDHGVSAVQPDLVSEYMFLDSVIKNDGLLQLARVFNFPQPVLQSSTELQILTILNQSAYSFKGGSGSILYKYLSGDFAILVRIAMKVATQSEGPIASIAAKILSEMDSSNLAIELMAELPEKSNSLKPLALAATERAYRQLPDLNNSSMQEIETYVSGKINLSNRAHNDGNYILSLQAAVDAVNASASILRNYPTEEGTIRSSVAISIAHSWQVLGTALEYSERLHTNIKTVEFAGYPQIPLDLGLVPITLIPTNSLSNAVAAATAAAQIFGEFSKEYPADFSMLHAVALNGLSNRQGKFGSIKESLVSIRSVIDINRHVLVGDVDWVKEVREKDYSDDQYSWESAYASSLVNLSNRLSNDWFKNNNSLSLKEKTNLEIEILSSIEESLEFSREHARAFPDTYEYEYATSLINYSSRLQEQNKFESALRIADEAVLILRRLHAQNYSPDNLRNLAEALSSRGKCYKSLGDLDNCNQDLREVKYIQESMAYKPVSSSGKSDTE